MLARTNGGGDGRLLLALAGAFGVVAVLAAVDLASDVGTGATARHFVLEGSLFVVGLGGFLWMGLRLRRLAAETRSLSLQTNALAHDLAATRREAEKWRQDASDLIAGLAGAIDRQLEHWGLTPAEKEVALLLLKGLSHKEIGQIRDVSEGTVRQQARALYEKAGLEGRHDLAAFFLEDLLGPRAATPPDETSGLSPAGRRRAER